MAHTAEEQISAYLDRQLGPEETRALETHARECPDCRALIEEMGRLDRVFREAERFEPSPFLWSRVAAEQQARRGWKERILDGLKGFSLKHGMAAAAAAIIIFAGTAIVKEINIYMADQAALAEIDRTGRTLAAQDPDAYNPFIFSSPRDLEVNPFSKVRLNGRTAGAAASNHSAENQ